MRRIAYFSPLPPAPTGVADYSETLLPHLSSAIPVDLFAEDPSHVRMRLESGCTLFHVREYPRISAERHYESHIYQMGNSPFHGFLYSTLLREPGVTVLHDVNLHSFYEERTLGHGDTAGYRRELGYAGGMAGARLAREIVLGNALGIKYRPALFERVVDASQAVLTHSKYAAELVRTSRPEALIAQAPMIVDAFSCHSVPSRMAELRRRWGIPSDALVIAQFGRIAPERRPHAFLGAIRRLLLDYPTLVCLMVGEIVPPFDIRSLIREYGLSNRVRLTDYLQKEDFFAAFDLADVAVNLRFPTAGETSAVAIQLLSRGVPTIVTDCGSYTELPDEVVIKIGAGGDEEAQLFFALSTLCRSPDLRQVMRENARYYIQRAHAPEHVVNAYLDVIRRVQVQLY